MLNMLITRREGWVREDRVPLRTPGFCAGVEFSADDITEIARMRPELMGGRRVGRRAGCIEPAADRRRTGGYTGVG